MRLRERQGDSETQRDRETVRLRERERERERKRERERDEERNSERCERSAFVCLGWVLVFCVLALPSGG